ncbi:BolA-like protein 1 [Desmophyllum pertusum]|uniref:BolA-like protein 1 n=1 Tax=Desmophyllum pertusum TaxID=174260 RepID=A0A9W9YPW8_9CNID|nr:BolA-like protein 1 [Desmophyllum pertusum]
MRLRSSKARHKKQIYQLFKDFFMLRGCLTRILPAIVQRPRETKLLSTASQAMMSVQEAITQKLTKEFKPVYLDVMNESYMHNVPKGSETHFKVVVVSSNFDDKPLIQRHRMVNEILKEELTTGVHALSIQAKTPEQWESSTKSVPKSPPCMGGSAR